MKSHMSRFAWVIVFLVVSLSSCAKRELHAERKSNDEYAVRNVSKTKPVPGIVVEIWRNELMWEDAGLSLPRPTIVGKKLEKYVIDEGLQPGVTKQIYFSLTYPAFEIRRIYAATEGDLVRLPSLPKELGSLDQKNYHTFPPAIE